MLQISRSRTFRVAVTFAVAVVALGACARSSSSQVKPAAQPSWLSATDVKDGWRSLGTLDQWRMYQTDSAPRGWTANDSIMGKSGPGVDIVSRKTYSDFELAFDWMVDAGGNSGVFYRATEEYPKVYWSAPEYAVLDDAKHPDGRNVITSAGAAHSLYPSPRGVVKAAGEWNSTRIVVKGTHVEHWLNGQMVVTYEFGNADYNERLAKSKFARWANFGKATSGFISLQGDHGGTTQYRHLRIRELTK